MAKAKAKAKPRAKAKAKPRAKAKGGAKMSAAERKAWGEKMQAAKAAKAAGGGAYSTTARRAPSGASSASLAKRVSVLESKVKANTAAIKLHASGIDEHSAELEMQRNLLDGVKGLVAPPVVQSRRTARDTIEMPMFAVN